jgi:hypothetical protein
MSARLRLVLVLAAGACTTPATVADQPEGPTNETHGDTDDASETSVFLPLPDSGSSDLCDAWQQDCLEGDKCVPYWSSDEGWTHQCVPVTGAQATGEPCSYDPDEATDDCDASGACWNVQEVDGELIGECARFCAGTPSEPICPSGSYCPLSSNGSLVLCQAACDPVADDCDEGTACTWRGYAFACMLTNDIPAGQPCQYTQDCAAGSVCVDAEVVPDCGGSACCAAYCDLDLGDGPCEIVLGSVCTPFFIEGEAPPEYAHVGVCGLP